MEVTEDEFDRVFAVNVKSIFHVGTLPPFASSPGRE
jgi:NAD(P)-dependent dehydrogenase (short-subunit alcohol dehydrogenase family)